MTPRAAVPPSRGPAAKAKAAAGAGNPQLAWLCAKGGVPGQIRPARLQRQEFDRRRRSMQVTSASSAAAPFPATRELDGRRVPGRRGRADPRFAQYKVIRRNGAVVGFEPAKISIAMTKAFLAINGGQGAASARVRDEVAQAHRRRRRRADEAQARRRRHPHRGNPGPGRARADARRRARGRPRLRALSRTAHAGARAGEGRSAAPRATPGHRDHRAGQRHRPGRSTSSA